MTTPPSPPPTALSIAGSDPSGGAGIQADLKTFSALGAYGMCVITALTAQSTQGVTGVHAVPADFVTQQLETLLGDITPDAVKIGMLADADVTRAVGRVLGRLRADEDDELPVVLDPVMVATSGDRLLDESAVAAVRELVPLASIITPNLPEAAVLLDAEPATTVDEMVEQARALVTAGARRAYVKGGHHTSTEQATDVLADTHGHVLVTAERVPTRHTHGTGCTLSSALAALRPRRPDWETTCRDAKSWLTEALRHADELHVGHGHGPVHHFHDVWSRA